MFTVISDRVNMNILWAPWREKYVVKASRPAHKDRCVFCDILREKKDRKTFIFIRTKHAFAVLNIYPFNGGHSLAVPLRHVDDIDKLSADELQDLMALVIRVKKLTTRALQPHAFNIGINLGSAAGAGIPSCSRTRA